MRIIEINKAQAKGVMSFNPQINQDYQLIECVSEAWDSHQNHLNGGCDTFPVKMSLNSYLRYIEIKEVDFK